MYPPTAILRSFGNHIRKSLVSQFGDDDDPEGYSPESSMHTGAASGWFPSPKWGMKCCAAIY